MPSPEELAFLSRVRERPDDDGPRLIFADWFDERGDARGEFIRVQCALARLSDADPRRTELEQREKELLDKHQARWTAGLQGLSSSSLCTYRRGFVESISVDAKAFLERGKEIFRYGPIRHVRFFDVAGCLAALADSPLLSLIPEIDLCGNSLGNSGVDQLARSKRLQNLEYLNLGFNDLTDQALRTLAGMPQLSQLRELYLNDNRQIGTPGLRALADSASLPNLRHLDLSGNLLSGTALRVLINGDALKKLDSLNLSGNPISDEGVAALANSELLKRMLARSPILRLPQNMVGPIGASALAESPVVAAMEELNLESNVIGNKGLESLAQSPYLRLKRLIVTSNGIDDQGVFAIARGRLPETLEYLDLRGNFITEESTIAIDRAAREFDLEKKIKIFQDPGLHLRQPDRPESRS